MYTRRSIGRVTEGLLLRIAENVDIVEPVSKFTDRLKATTGVRTIFNVGLEDWQPPEGIEYDLIWTQWCLGHLTDSQLVDYLQLCKTVLKPDTGVIVIKENLSTGSVDMFDNEDSSVTRSVHTLTSAAIRRLKLIVCSVPANGSADEMRRFGISLKRQG